MKPSPLRSQRRPVLRIPVHAFVHDAELLELVIAAAVVHNRGAAPLVLRHRGQTLVYVGRELYERGRHHFTSGMWKNGKRPHELQHAREVAEETCARLFPELVGAQLCEA